MRPMCPETRTIWTIWTPTDASTRSAHGSGPCLGDQVEVRVLSSASVQEYGLVEPRTQTSAGGAFHVFRGFPGQPRFEFPRACAEPVAGAKGRPPRYRLFVGSSVWGGSPAPGRDTPPALQHRSVRRVSRRARIHAKGVAGRGRGLRVEREWAWLRSLLPAETGRRWIGRCRRGSARPRLGRSSVRCALGLTSPSGAADEPVCRGGSI
jgi:hypothetical protein